MRGTTIGEMTGLHTEKGVQIGKCRMRKGREDQEEMQLMAGLLDQDMGGQLHHQIVTAAVDIDLAHLMWLAIRARCLVISNP